MNKTLRSLEELSSQMRLLLLLSLMILVVYLLVKNRIDRISFRMFLPATNKVASTRQQFISPDIEYSVTIEFYKPFSFFCNCRILLHMNKLPYSRVLPFPGPKEAAPLDRLSSSYVLKNYPYSDLQAHRKFVSNSKKSEKKHTRRRPDRPRDSDATRPSNGIIRKAARLLQATVMWLPRQLARLWSGVGVLVDQFSVDRIKEFRLRKKFPLFLDFYLPSRVKHVKLNGMTLPPVVFNGRIYLDDRFLKLGANEVRIQYYSKVDMLPVGLRLSPHRLAWEPQGAGLAGLFPSFDQSLFNISLSCLSRPNQSRSPSSMAGYSAAWAASPTRAPRPRSASSTSESRRARCTSSWETSPKRCTRTSH